MRWIWIDRFTEFESGSHATAIKNVSLAEEHLQFHFPCYPVMPTSLIVEGLAQTGGILLGEKNRFQHIVILAKLPSVTFHGWAVPGETLTYHAKLLDAREEGGSVACTAHVEDRLIAETKIVFVHLDQNDPEFGKINQKNFVFSSNLMCVVDAKETRDNLYPAS